MIAIEAVVDDPFSFKVLQESGSNRRKLVLGWLVDSLIGDDWYMIGKIFRWA